jgi:hypothetical protein
MAAAEELAAMFPPFVWLLRDFTVRRAHWRKGPYYTVAHTTPHTTLNLNKNREALRQRK